MLRGHVVRFRWFPAYVMAQVIATGSETTLFSRNRTGISCGARFDSRKALRDRSQSASIACSAQTIVTDILRASRHDACQAEKPLPWQAASAAA